MFNNEYSISFQEHELILIYKVLYRYKFEQSDIGQEYFEVIGSPVYVEVQKRIQEGLLKFLKERDNSYKESFKDLNIFQYPDAVNTIKQVLLYINFNSLEETKKIDFLKRIMFPFKDDDNAIHEFMQFLKNDSLSK